MKNHFIHYQFHLRCPKIVKRDWYFDLNLSLSHSFSISSFNPYSIAGYNRELYVGDKVGTILVIVNEVVLHVFNACNGNTLTIGYILFDQCGLMATSCNPNQLYLSYPNGTYVGKSFVIPSGPQFIGFDSKSRFVQISNLQISIYN